jgi:ribonuclease I
MICKKGYITELRFSLNGDIHTDSFYKLLKNGKNLKGGCDRGIVK